MQSRLSITFNNRHIVGPFERLTILGLFIVFPAISDNLPSKTTDGAQPSNSAIAAVINGVKIGLGELDDTIRPQLKEVEARLFQARKAALESLINEKLFILDAEQHGSSPKEYIDILVSGKPITDAEIETIYSRMEKRLHGIPTAQAKEQIHRELIESRRRECYSQRVRELRAKANVDVLLQPPTPPRGKCSDDRDGTDSWSFGRPSNDSRSKNP